MGKSKHRKDHKKKVQAYKQKQNRRTNVMNSLFQEQLVKMMEKNQELKTEGTDDGGE
jgi:hypothetical protein